MSGSKSTASRQAVENDWTAVAICASGLFLNSYALTNVFPYLGPMVVHLGKVEHVDKAGYYAGFLGAAFMAARAFTSFLWGELSDNFGRRPVMMVGCISFMIFQVMLGFATSFEVAVMARLLMGFFNPVVGLAKTIVCEVVDDENQTKALSRLSGWAALGLVIGPTFGGWLSEPAEKFSNSSIFNSAFFERFPFVLPNLFGSLVSAVTLVGVSCYLPETLKKRNDEYVELKQSVPDEESEDSENPRTEVETGIEKAHSLEEFEEDLSAVPGDVVKHPGHNSIAKAILKNVCPFMRMYNLMCDKEKRLSAMMYSYYSFTSIFNSEMIPLWFIASRASGGLGLSTSQIGSIMSTSGIGLFLYNSFILPLYAHKWSTLMLMRLNLILISMLYAALPLLSSIGQVQKGDSLPEWFLVLVCVASIANAVLNNNTFVCCNLIVNNSCYSDERGAMNGLVMALGSVFKALGPLLGAEIFAWSINSKNPFPFDYHFSFYLLSVGCVLLCLYSSSFPLTLNSKRV